MRRGDPERIYRAQRAGIVAEIADTIGPERAERVIAHTERDAESLGLASGSFEFWQEADRRGVPTRVPTTEP